MTGYALGPVLSPGERPWPEQWERSIVCMVCPHTAWESVLVPPSETSPCDEVVRCTVCHAPRCGGTREDDPCMKVLNHLDYHWLVSGRLEKPVPVS
jgi:hypothetical protein